MRYKLNIFDKMERVSDKARNVIIQEAWRLVGVMKQVAPIGLGSLKRSIKCIPVIDGDDWGMAIVSNLPYAKSIYRDKEDRYDIEKAHMPRNKASGASFEDYGRMVREELKRKGSRRKSTLQKIYNQTRSQKIAEKLERLGKKTYKQGIRTRNYFLGLRRAKEGEFPYEVYVYNYPAMAMEQIGGLKSILEKIDQAIK